MIFVRYSPETGELTGVGVMDPDLFEIAIDAGDAIIPADHQIDFVADRYRYKVDIQTKKLIESPSQAPAAEPTPMINMPITDRQFWQQAAIAGLITQDEALEATKTGFIPEPISSWIDSIENDAERFSAEMFFAGATMLARHDPRIIKAGELFGLTPDDLDAFFTAARTL